ncbi:hypothetical protein [Flavobacterium aquidurense]|uniref:Uncharacterized protein n=1 Tax=Flavobacterium aquidurense TaxID=362413 RepID=A0A0Q0VZL3_9FLAO|nr:hypothetical protein [Flavobacterium aquidurense]KQB39474.1 hypothetical protein RC62_1155 [Flavobacterium aquidurense]
MATNINTILNWFKTGKKPTQEQFWSSWQSFWHKDETIPQNSITNLVSSLDSKENLGNKSLTISSSSTNNDYPSSKTVYDFVNEFVKTENNLNTEDILNLVESNSLIPGNYYLINDFQTIYTINGSDSAPNITTKRIDSFPANYAALNGGYDLNLIVGKTVVISKLPAGYSGALTVGSSTTVSLSYLGYYFRFANGMQNVLGLEFEYSMPRYSNGIADNLVVNDSNGKPVIRPGGVLNTEVHNGTQYMNMLADENPGVPLESIILRAKSTNEFELEGKSITYPDDIIEYRLPVAGNVATKGTILRRYNNALNIDLKIDWRVQRYRRWKISADSILKILNQDQPVTSLTGFAGVYQFTATNSTKTTTERFYIASDLDSESLAIDADTKIIDFTMEVSSYDQAKDFTIFKIDQNHQPVNIKMMKVSGSFDNTVIQNNLSEINFDTNIDAEVLSNTTFVCSVTISGTFSKIYESLFLDSFHITSDNSKAEIVISKIKSLPYFMIEGANSSQIFNSVIGVNTNNYSSAPNPSVRWLRIENIQGSFLKKVLLGGSSTYYNFNNSQINNCTLFFYYNQRNEYSILFYENSKLIFNNCLMLSMSIFNRSKLGNVIFNDILSNVFYAPPSVSGRDIYTNSTDLNEIQIKMNKYNHKLFYEERDASDILTVKTYATPLP